MRFAPIHAFSSVKIPAVPALLLAMAAFLLAGPSARAGSYIGTYAVPIPNTDPVAYMQIPYSGGTHYSETGQSSPGHFTFGDVSDSLTGTDYGGASSGNGIPGEGGHSDCSGEIDTSFTWQPDTGQTLATDPPPAQVIVKQTCTVSVSIGLPGGTGAYSTGLGTSGSFTFNPPNSSSKTAADTRYFVHDGGATVSLDAIDPNASVTNAPSTAQLGYSASVSPVTIKLTGTTKDSGGGDHILIGQECQAELQVTPGACTVANIQWTATGKTIQGWTGDAGGSTGSIAGAASPYTFTQASLSSTKPAWYWSDNAATETVTCTATVTPPSGQGSSFTVSASRDVTLEEPTFSESDSAGVTRIDDQDPKISGYALWGGWTTTNPHGNGSNWADSVNTPPLYAGQTPAGQWAHLQIITVNGTQTTGGNADPVPNAGQTGLDGGFQYDGIFPDNGVQYTEGDNPGINLLNAYTNYSLNYSFDQYVMYIPPGSKSTWVPLTKLTWTWAPNVQEPVLGWAAWPSGTSPGGDPNVPNLGTRWTTEPTWTQKITGN